MKIDFKKVSREPKYFELVSDDLSFCGYVRHKSGQLYEFSASLVGEIELVCDRSGEEYVRKLDEHFSYLLSDGIFTTTDSTREESEVVEFFEGHIDVAFLLESELESIRSEYAVLE